MDLLTRRRWAAWIVAAACLIAGPAAAQALAAGEYALKAAFLFNFAKFVEWPAESFASPSAPLEVCVVGDSSVADIFESTLGSKMVNQRELVVRRLTKATELKTCQILYQCGKQCKTPLAPEYLNQPGILTVGENEEFLAQGGMIRFLKQGNKIRFDIRRENVEHSRLKVSSKLLALSAGEP